MRVLLGSVGLASVIGFLATLAPAAELSRVDESRASSLASQYVKAQGRRRAEYSFKLFPFGKSTWIINCYLLGMTPSLPSRYVMNSKGDISALTADSLSNAFLNEYPSSMGADDRKALLERFAQLHSGERVVILRSTSDIPGYSKAPLDPDVADALRAPFEVNGKIEIMYTYQQIEGLVTRYRFTFDKASVFRHAEAVVVGRGVGEAQYYE